MGQRREGGLKEEGEEGGKVKRQVPARFELVTPCNWSSRGKREER
jgi:hypothetical protein